MNASLSLCSADRRNMTGDRLPGSRLPAPAGTPRLEDVATIGPYADATRCRGTAPAETARPPAEFDMLDMTIDFAREDAEYAAYLARNKKGGAA